MPRSNLKQIVENIEYQIEQANRLLNVNDKKSDAYKIIIKDIQGLKSALRVAKSNLKTKVKSLKRQISLTKAQLKASKAETEKAKCQKELNDLNKELKEIS